MRLYVVRHGDYDTTDVFQRLNRKGADDIQCMAYYLRDQGVQAREIWHSPKTRAAESAEIFRQILSCPIIKEKDCLSPNASPDQIMQDVGLSDQDILMVSHLPFIPRLLTEMAMQETVSYFPTAAVAVLERVDGQWEMIDHITPESGV